MKEIGLKSYLTQILSQLDLVEELGRLAERVGVSAEGGWELHPLPSGLGEWWAPRRSRGDGG